MPAVAAGQDDHQRDGAVVRPGESGHEAVARQQPRFREAPVPYGIVRGGVGPGEVDDEPRPHRLEHGRQGLTQRPHKELVPHVAPERDRGGGHRLGLAPVVVVDREGVDGRVVGEDPARSVAVVEVEVHHEDGLGETPAPQAADGDRHVVEDAEAEAGVGHRVMEAAAEVDGRRAGSHREAGGLDGAARHQPLQVEGRLHLPGRHLDAQDPREGLRLLDGVEVLGGVDAEEVLQGRRAGSGEEIAGEEPRLLERSQDPLPAEGVHRHAEDTALVAHVVDDGYPARPQAIERAADDPGERAKGTLAHRDHCLRKAPTGAAVPPDGESAHNTRSCPVLSTTSCLPERRRATSSSGASSSTWPTWASRCTRPRRRRFWSSSRERTSS